MTLIVEDVKNAYNRDMRHAGLKDTEQTAMRLACVFAGAYYLKMATERDVVVPNMPDIPQEHQQWVQRWLVELVDNVDEAIMEAYEETDSDDDE